MASEMFEMSPSRRTDKIRVVREVTAPEQVASPQHKLEVQGVLHLGIYLDGVPLQHYLAPVKERIQMGLRRLLGL